ncbi:hypothetical protein [Streptomyces bauhiniae]|uniref:hypothetical protein n=1 Tax=Streptomyces bauhiniae TaxID=2340725 RepID=UPI0035D59693
MKLSSQSSKAALAMGVACSLGVAAMLGTAGTASAATSKTFELCASGNYTVYAEFPQLGGFSTTLINRGDCWKGTVSAQATYAKVRGLYNTSTKEFYVGTAHFSSKGWKGAARGTTTSPNLVTN